MTQWLLLAASPLILAFVIACIREPLRVALPVFAALIFFGKGLAFSSSPFGSLSSLAGIVLGLGLALQLVTNRPSAKRLSLSIPVWLLFLAMGVASVSWSIDRSTTVQGVAVLASLVLVYVLVALSEVDRAILRRTEDGLLVGGVVVVCYGLYQLVFLGGFPSDRTGVIGSDGRFGNDLLGPGVQAVSLLLPFALALHRGLAVRTSSSSRLLYAMIATLMFAGVLMTGSRTGTIAAGLVVLTLAWSGPRRARWPLLATFLAGLAAATLVWVFQPAGVTSRTYETATSSSGRTDIWQVGLAACSDFCDAGSGWGTFPEVYAETQATVPGARVLAGDQGSYQPHNLWLLAVIELGVAGAALLTWGLGLALLEASRIPRERRGPPLGALVGLVFAVMFLSSLEFKFFWMVLIMVALHRNLTLAEAARGDTGAGTAEHMTTR